MIFPEYTIYVNIYFLLICVLHTSTFHNIKLDFFHQFENYDLPPPGKSYWDTLYIVNITIIRYKVGVKKEQNNYHF